MGTPHLIVYITCLMGILLNLCSGTPFPEKSTLNSPTVDRIFSKVAIAEQYNLLNTNNNNNDNNVNHIEPEIMPISPVRFGGRHRRHNREMRRLLRKQRRMMREQRRMYRRGYGPFYRNRL
ncbi:unnamed protein product [Trichobilharzia szidati]|nr:unnamed protein product [Trichobilharzia szidati]